MTLYVFYLQDRERTKNFDPSIVKVLFNLLDQTRHILSIGINSGQWVLQKIDNNLLKNLGYSTELNTLVSSCSSDGICSLNQESYRWDLLLPIPDFHDIKDWTFSADKQKMYFISKENLTLVDISDKSSFNYRVFPLIQQTGNMTTIDKTVVFVGGTSTGCLFWRGRSFFDGLLSVFFLILMVVPQHFLI